MKKVLYCLLLFICLVFISCKKEDDIIIEGNYIGQIIYDLFGK